MLRLPPEATISHRMLAALRESLGMHVLDARFLHPVTAERRTEARERNRPADAVCTHHFVSSWVDHSKELHEDTEARRKAGDAKAAMHGRAQRVKLD